MKTLDEIIGTLAICYYGDCGRCSYSDNELTAIKCTSDLIKDTFEGLARLTHGEERTIDE